MPWRYRRKLTLALRREGSRWIAGLFRYDVPEVFELRDCLITHEAVVDAWRQVLAQQHLLPGGKELRAAVRLLPAGFSFTLEGAQEWNAYEQFFGAIRTLSELWWQPEGKSRRRLLSRSASEQAGASFTQVNPGVAGMLREWVVSLATAVRPQIAKQSPREMGIERLRPFVFVLFDFAHAISDSSSSSVCRRYRSA